MFSMNARAGKLDSRLRCTLVWLLCLCSWRAPVPVLHCHADAHSIAAQSLSGESNITASTAQLLSHVTSFHAGLAELSGSHWHLHFVLPTPAPESDDCPDQDRVPVLPLSAADSAMADLSDLAADYSAGQRVPGFDNPAEEPAVIIRDAPRLIPLAPPRVRPKRLLPVIAFCVARC